MPDDVADDQHHPAVVEHDEVEPVAPRLVLGEQVAGGHGSTRHHGQALREDRVVQGREHGVLVARRPRRRPGRPHGAGPARPRWCRPPSSTTPLTGAVVGRGRGAPRRRRRPRPHRPRLRPASEVVAERERLAGRHHLLEPVGQARRGRRRRRTPRARRRRRCSPNRARARALHAVTTSGSPSHCQSIDGRLLEGRQSSIGGAEVVVHVGRSHVAGRSPSPEASVTSGLVRGPEADAACAVPGSPWCRRPSTGECRSLPDRDCVSPVVATADTVPVPRSA